MTSFVLPRCSILIVFSSIGFMIFCTLSVTDDEDGLRTPAREEFKWGRAGTDLHTQHYLYIPRVEVWCVALLPTTNLWTHSSTGRRRRPSVLFSEIFRNHVFAV